MNAVLTIARASITEHVRRKLVLFFLAMAVLAAAGLIYVGLDRDLSASLMGATVGLATVLALGLLQSMTTLAAIALSMNNIGRPFNDGEAAMLLARPLARWQYAIGRLVASVALVFGLCLVIALLLQGVNLLEGRSLGLQLWGHWATHAFNLTLLISITTLMSALLLNPILAALVSFFIYSSSTLVSTLYLLVETGRVGGAPKAVITALWYLTPKRLISPMAASESAPGAEIVDASSAVLLSNHMRLIWALVYLAVTISLTLAVVKRKEL